MKVLTLAELGHDPHVDVVIVGSGASGAVMAAILAEAGHRVLVVEEGEHFTSRQLGAMSPGESLSRVWRDAGTAPAIGLGGGPNILVQMGKLVGGSSALTGGVCFRIPEDVLHHWSTDLGLSELTPQGMLPFFEEVEQAIHVETVPASMRSRSAVLFEEGAQKQGFSLDPVRRNTLNCTGHALCNFGCPTGAKRSVDLTYLPRAVQAGAHIVQGALVRRLLIKGDRVVGVRGKDLATGARFTIHAGTVVLAAGAWYTPQILARSGVGRRSQQVGRNLTLHPAFRVAAVFDQPVHGFQGALQSTYTDAFVDEGITLVNFFVPPPVLVTAIAGAGPSFVEQASQADHLAVFGGILHDDPAGRVRRGPGREPIVTYRMTARDKARIPRILEILAETYFAAGARSVYLPIMGQPALNADEFRAFDLSGVPGRSIECTSQHPLGTCRMGVNPASSVVDPDGRVWDLGGLVIADGGVLPTSLGVNPQVGIMAMATRVAHKLRASLA